MSDMTMSGAPVRAPAERSRNGRVEFAIYFALIFAVTVPLSCLTWGLTLLRSGRWPGRGPVTRAWSQARIITPRIFAA